MALTTDPTRQLILRGEKAASSFEEFVRFVGGFTPAAHQRTWIKELQEVGENPAGKKVLLVAPPGSGKTTVAVLFTAWMIGRYPDDHCGYFSYADQVAWERSRAVREILEKSPAYRIVFPTIRPNPKNWGVSSFQIQRSKIGDPHPTLRAGGTTSSVVAYRLNGLIIDDPHDPKNANTPAAREKVLKNYDEAIDTRVVAAGWRVVIGTRWADTDLIGSLERRSGWKVVKLTALRKSPEGLVSYWPEHYPVDFLEQKRFEAPATFAIQYMADTTGGDTGIIKSVKKFYQVPEVLKEELDLVCASGWDTAFKRGEENDFSVGYVGGLDKYGNIYVLDRYKGRYGFQELLDIIAEAHERWGLFNTWIEDAASGTPAVQGLMAQVPHLPVMSVKPTAGGKPSRAHALAPFLHRGSVLLYANADWFEDAKYNLTFYPFVDHDDDIDALFILVNNLQNIRHPNSLVERPSVRLVMR